MITTWYLQSQRTWDKLCHSCIGSSFLPRGAFPEGRAYAFLPRLHAGSLEALRVSRPEAVVLAINNSVMLDESGYFSLAYGNPSAIRFKPRRETMAGNASVDNLHALLIGVDFYKENCLPD